MSEEEQNHLKQLPSTVTIYRGCYQNELNKKTYGISWTLEQQVAEFFANRPIKNTLGKVVSLNVPKERIIGYLKDRQEEEIIYIPDWILETFNN